MKRILSLFVFFSGISLAQNLITFEDDFNSGLDNWVISSQGNSCTWESYFPPYPNPYLIPGADGGIMAADADQCGADINTIAMLDTILDMSGYFCVVYISWSNDWMAINWNDTAFAEISSDFGNSWEVMWEKDGISAGNSQEGIYYDEYLSSDIDFLMFRFRTVQHGPGSWWAIDNFQIQISAVLEIPATPENLTAQLTGQNSDVLLNWDFTPTPSYELGFQITRKQGDPWPYNDYEILDSTDIAARSYLDTTALDNILYSYRIRAYSYQFISFFSEPAVVVTPVEFISFTASTYGQNVVLNWVSATETNNMGFIIERNAGEAFRDIGFITGSGTVSEQQSYSFTDKNVSPGKYLYRLKQVDFDGSYQFSNELEISVKTPAQFSLNQNYPNPFNPSTVIKYEIPFAGKVEMKVFDLLGREIAVLVKDYMEEGIHTVRFNGDNLPSGVYLYRIRTGNYTETRKMILQK